MELFMMFSIIGVGMAGVVLVWQAFSSLPQIETQKQNQSELAVIQTQNHQKPSCTEAIEEVIEMPDGTYVTRRTVRVFH